MTDKLSPGAAALVEAEALKAKLAKANEDAAKADGIYAAAVNQAEAVRVSAQAAAKAALDAANAQADADYDAAVQKAAAGPQKAQADVQKAKEELDAAVATLRDKYDMSLSFSEPAGGGRVALG